MTNNDSRQQLAEFLAGLLPDQQKPAPEPDSPEEAELRDVARALFQTKQTEENPA